MMSYAKFTAGAMAPAVRHSEESAVRDIKEIQEEIDAEREKLNGFYRLARDSAEAIGMLEREWVLAKGELGKKPQEEAADKFLFDRFGIEGGQKEAKENLFIVFDKRGSFIRTAACGPGKEFHHVSPADDKGTLKHWLMANKYYAHNACSFCGRDSGFYRMAFREQLENLGWEFGQGGTLVKTQW